MHLPTVRIVSPVSDENPHGFIVINQSDFDHTRHEAWVEAAPESAPETQAKPRRAKA